MQDTVAEMATDISRRKGSNKDAQDLDQFLNKVGGREAVNCAWRRQFPSFHISHCGLLA